MNFKLIGENNFNLDPIGTIFRNRGVAPENIEEILNVGKQHIIPYKYLKNIDRAVKCLVKHMKENNKIFVQVDSDCDGYCSAAILINYLRRINPNVNIVWSLQTGKQHGIALKNVPNDVSLVIIPDAGSNQEKEHLELNQKGIDVIVLDHHECEKESEHAIIVNNQLSPQYLNKNLSGAGIVYKFCQALDEKFSESYADDFLDLVAIGNVGDMMDLRELETRYYVKKGLEKIKNPFIKEIIFKQDFSMKGIVNIHNVAFYVVPLINAIVRASTAQEKNNMMKSFLESKDMLFYKRKNEYEPIQVATVRAATNTRARQNKAKDKGLVSIEEYVVKKNLLKMKALIIDVTDLMDKNFTGLAANQIAKKYKRPVILLRKLKESLYGGSARGFEQGEIKDFKKFLIGSKLFKLCEGHPNAFGVEIEEAEIPKLHSYFEENLKDEIDLDSYEVDFILEEGDLDKDLITEIASYRDEWGSVLKEPEFAIKDVRFQIENISLVGKRVKNLKMIHNSCIEFIKLYFKKDLFESYFSEGETFYMDIVGRFKINNWDGKQIPQIEIVKMKINDVLYF